MPVFPTRGNVVAASPLADNAVIRGDGGAKGIQDSSVLVADTGVMSVPAIGDGGYTSYDLCVGNLSSYGMIQMGRAAIGRTSFKAGNIDLDGTVLCRNIDGPVTSEIEFIWAESTGGDARFALPKSGVGNATWNSRSLLCIGPAPANTDFVKVSYWQALGHFPNLVCDTDGTGADLGVQNDIEAGGILYVDNIQESTLNAGVIVEAVLIKDGLVDGVNVGTHAARHTDGSDDIRDATIDLKGIAKFFDRDFLVANGLVFLGLRDSDQSDRLYLVASSNLTDTRTLSFATGDASRTITLAGNPTLADWFDQSVKQAASPTFGGLLVNSKTVIDGSADEFQLHIKGHSTQTQDVVRIEDSAANPLLRLVAIGTAGDVGSLIVGKITAGGPTDDTAILVAVAGGITHTGSPVLVLKGLSFFADLNANQAESYAVRGVDLVAGGNAVVAAGKTGQHTGGRFLGVAGGLQTSITANIICYGGSFQAGAGFDKHDAGNFRLISGIFLAPDPLQGTRTSELVLAALFLDDIQVVTNKKIILSGSTTVEGDDYIVCDATTMKFYVDGNLQLTIADGLVTVINDFLVLGDQVFSTTGTGLPFAEIYCNGANDTLAIGGAGVGNKVQVTSFTHDGQSNNMTPDHTNDHITVVKAGMYLCTVSLHIESAGGGAADTFAFTVYKNNGATPFDNVHGHRKLAGGGGDVGSLSLSGVIDLAAADTIELWCWNEDSDDDVKIQDVTLSLVQIGGT